MEELCSKPQMEEPWWAVGVVTVTTWSFGMRQMEWKWIMLR